MDYTGIAEGRRTSEML